MVTDVLPLPDGDEPPSPELIADCLAAALPEDDRAAGRSLLTGRILPGALSGLAGHPRPRRLAEVVYEDLAERLRDAAPGERLEALELAADVAEIRALSARAQSLAVARYLSDHPDAAPRAGVWLDGEADRWRERPAGEIALEAQRVLDDLEAWAERVREERPEMYETRRMDYVNAKLALQSAASGAFGASAGPLSDFLARVGAPSDRLDIH